jgi:hypothetical protein
MMGENWKTDILAVIDKTIEEWTTAFDGPPEQQIDALNFLADLRDQVAATEKGPRND